MPADYAGDSANYPVTITRPSDGDAPDAESVQEAVDGLADRTENLRVNYMPKSGGTFSGSVTFGAQATFSGQTTLTSTVDVTDARFCTADPHTEPGPSPITVDASIAGHQHIFLPDASFGTVTMKSSGTSRSLVAGMTCRLMLPPPPTTPFADGDGLKLYYTVKREGGTVICELHGFGISSDGSTIDTYGHTWVDLYFDGTNWRGLTPAGHVVTGAGW